MLGEDSARIISVEINGDKNVGCLQNIIKQKKKFAFDHINANSLDANNLKVWDVSDVSIPIDDDMDFEAKVRNLGLHKKKLLSSTKGLLKIFRNLDKEALHVVVKSPLLLLNCWVLGEDSARIFSVEINGNKNVGCLKNAIKEEMKPAFDHITANSLDVWNVSIPIDRDTNIEEQVENLKVLQTKCLLPVELLSNIFRNVVEKYLHVIVWASTGECSPDFACPPLLQLIRGESESINHMLRHTPLWYTSALLCG